MDARPGPDEPRDARTGAGPEAYPPAPREWLVGGGEAGDLVRARDWSGSALGARHEWPSSLRTAAALVLAGTHPMMLLWGDDLTVLPNDACCVLLEGRASDSLGRPCREAWPSLFDRLAPVRAQVLRGGAVRLDRASRGRLDLECSPVRTERGDVGGMLVLLEPAGEPGARGRGDEAQQGFMLGLSDALRPLSDPVEIQGVAARTLGEHLGTDRAGYAEIVDSGGVECFRVIRGYNSSRVFSVSGIDRPVADFGPAMLEAIRSHRTLVVADVETDPRFADRRAEFCALRILSFVMVPIVKRGRHVAVLGLHHAEPREWTAYDLAIAEGTAERTWATVERAKVEERLRGNEARQAFLLALGDAIRVVDEPERIEATVTRMLGRHLGAAWCYCSVVDPETGLGEIRSVHSAEHVAGIGGRYPPDEVCPAGGALASVDVANDEQLVVRMRRRLLAFSIRAFMAVPLVGDPRWPAFLWVGHDTTRAWTAEETNLVADVAARACDALERARAQRALREANARLRDADRRKDEFLAMLSHELRNPLAPIRNGLTILQRAAPGGEVAHRALEIIGRQTAQLTHLVDELLDANRISRNKVQLRLAPLDLGGLVAAVLEDHRWMFDQLGLRLELERPPVPLPVSADRHRLAQVLGNLLTNAAKFTVRGGRVAVTAREEDGRAVVRVADDGIGIAPETLPVLFHPFAQADMGLDRGRGGLGLGLAVVKGLVEQHGGEVTASSPGLDRGSEFVMRLPLLAASATPGPARSAGERHARRRVLLVEDDLDAVQSLRDLLELAGHEVVVAHEGREGLERAREHRPEFILCDIGLPGMSGYQVAREVRRDEALRGTCLVALSGYAYPEDVQRAEEAGFDHHLAKPPTIEALESLFAEWTADRSPRRG